MSVVDNDLSNIGSLNLLRKNKNEGPATAPFQCRQIKERQRQEKENKQQSLAEVSFLLIFHERLTT